MNTRTKTVDGVADAKSKAAEYIETIHPNVMRIFSNRVFVEEDSWVMRGEFWFRRAHFFVTRRYYRIRMKAKTGEIISYEEKRHSTPA